MAGRGGILVFTSSFPHRENPVNGIFIRDFVHSIRAFAPVSVLAPEFPGTAATEEDSGVRIHHFPQCCPPGRMLAGTPGGIPPVLKKHPAMLLVLPFFLLSELISLARTVKSENVAVIHAHWLIPQGFVAAVYKFLLNRKVKLVITCHGSDVNKMNGALLKSLKRFALRRADRVVAVSEELAAKIRLLLPGCSCGVCSMGVDTAKFSPEAADSVLSLRDEYRLKSAPVLFVGSLIELKGVRELVAAWAKVVRAVPEAELLIVGDGELRGELEETVRRTGIADNVHFAGSLPHERLPRVFAASALFVLPSHSEGFPQVVCEALACATPVAVSDLPVFVSQPDAERLFRFCRMGDADSLAEALIAGLRAAARNDFGRRWVEERLSLPRVADCYRKIYGEVAGNAGGEA